MQSLNCTNPVEPEFDFKSGLIYVEGFLGTTEGSSFVTISESNYNEYYRNIFVSGADVAFINAETQARIPLFEENFEYAPNPDFRGEIGETWYLEITLPNGKKYLSEAETINSSVPITDISARYDPQLEFSEEYDRYVPGHEVSVTFDDPVDQTNYYFWRFKTFDQAIFCAICTGGFYDLNISDCVPLKDFDPFTMEPYFTYLCNEKCWAIEYGNTIEIFSDEFSNGATTSLLPVANVILTRKTKILVEIEQFSLTPKAYNYYKTIKDLIQNNSGFNTPLPAPLLGNMYNPQDSDEYVLGMFTASSAFKESIMIDRRYINEMAVGTRITANPEKGGDAGIVPGRADPLLGVPCEEGRYSTPIAPEGWID